MREMDQLLALHCAPTLLGIKPANLIRLSSEQIPRLTAAICEYDRLLSAKGIRLEMLCRCSTSALLLVHSPAQLQALLRRPPQRRMLCCRPATPRRAACPTSWPICKSAFAAAPPFLTRWAYSWGIPPAMWRPFSAATARDASCAATGKCIPTRKGRDTPFSATMTAGITCAAG